jgi:NAD(P)-dependent dehydrogenase (short-subunit alcohol dehydrogenase family)
MSTPELEGKVAVITGGGRGLGRGVALEMGRAGARLVVADIFRDKGASAADRVAKELSEIGVPAVASYEDVTSRRGAEAIVESAMSNFGRVDVLCTFAGNAVLSRVLDLTDEDFDSSMRVHLYGTFNCIKAALPHMIEQKSGRIVTVSSRGAFQGAVPAYSAAKAGIMGLTAAIAMEMTMNQTGVTVNCLLPSAVTQLFPFTGARPLGGMPAPLSTDPDDVAPVVVYLATDGAAGINGRFVYASGGDICVFALPFEAAGSTTIIRKQGRWTVDEVGLLIEPVVGSPPSGR